MEIDIEKLKNDLINYFGTLISFNSFAYMNLIEVENADFKRLIEIAVSNNFDLEDYIVSKRI